jgi:hypothetical protein
VNDWTWLFRGQAWLFRGQTCFGAKISFEPWFSNAEMVDHVAMYDTNSNNMYFLVISRFQVSSKSFCREEAKAKTE